VRKSTLGLLLFFWFENCGLLCTRSNGGYFRFLDNPPNVPGKTLENFLINIDESDSSSRSVSEGESDSVTEEEIDKIRIQFKLVHKDISTDAN
jgi:hypothetical protein